MLYWIAKFFVKIYLTIFYRIRVIGRENIPEEGGFILCANHISALDPVILIVNVNPKVHYMGKQELFKNKFNAYFLDKFGVFPVRRNTADMTSIRKAISILKKGGVLGIFPEGTRNRSKAEIKPQPGVALIAVKGNAKVLPVGIKSEYKLFGRVEVKIGKPIDLSKYNSKKLSTEELEMISRNIMMNIHALI